MKPIRLFAAAAILALAACSQSTTEPASAARPSFDGGNTMGSGNRDDGGETMNTADSGGDDSAAADTTSRGINTLGSGN